MTIAAPAFSVASAQATAFTPDQDVPIGKFIRELLPRWNDPFSADPTVLPALEGAPAEIPRVIIESGDQHWRCEVAPARLNIFWRKMAPSSRSPTLGDFYARATSLIVQYRDFFSCRIGRVAAVVNRYAEHETPGVFLARHFCSNRWERAPLNRPENFELHAHKKFALVAGLTVNSWVRNKTALLAAENPPKPIVLVEQDLNSLPEEQKNFSSDEIQQFFVASTAEFDTILRLYYPEE